MARRIGVSVRTLHYYEEIGLLKPSGRTPRGHRLYTPTDIERLAQIRSLQELGLSLTEIDDCLQGAGRKPGEIVEAHLERVREQRRTLDQLEVQLQRVAEGLAGGKHGDAQTTEDLLNVLELITMNDQYFTPEQLKQLEGHGNHAQGVTAAIAALDSARTSGVSPRSEEAGTLLQRFHESLEAATGGDDALRDAIFKMLHEQKSAREQHGISEELFAYMGSVAGGEDHS